MLKFCLNLVLIIALLQSILSAENDILVFYGSPYNSETDTTVLWGDELGNALGEGYTGVLVLGYFTTGADPFVLAGSLHESGIAPLLEAFNLLHQVNVSAAEFPGYIQGQGQVAEQGIGEKPYLLLLTGISEFENAHLATGIGLFSYSDSSTIPPGGDILPSDLIFKPFQYDQILLGVESEILEPDLLGFQYSAVAINCNLPLGLEDSGKVSTTWRESEWFGLFYCHHRTNWLYHETLGWVYPGDSDESWFWLSSTQQWSYTNSTLYPFFWLESSEAWMFHLVQSDRQAENYLWNSISSTWALYPE